MIFARTLAPSVLRCGARGMATQKDKKYFDKILVANRGEIAIRVMKTAKRLGIKTVAVYSEADAKALHVLMADEAVCIGPAPSLQSYLCADKIIKAMKDTGAQAVHPGYGFLSENAAFSEQLEKEGLIFIGPSGSAIKAMGDKIESKKLALKAGVSVVPGVNECIESPEHAAVISKQIGYPVMIKASAGGGGKGMRIAWNDEEAKEGFRLSKSEAINNFKDDRVFIEKFIVDPRHIEIQVMGDKHGNAIYLNERECSIQRRNQKVIEEAPSVVLDPETRRRMGEQAVQLAKAVGYSSAGTVEMIVDKDKNFYFLEMNTRLQVEHPVTEYITGLDLVEMMIHVAAGNPLPIAQSDVKMKGWAMESRVYAEDPMNNFMPCIGKLAQYREPDTSSGNVRCDSGILEGSEISVYYDPLICKLVTYGETRDVAIQRMVEALDQYVIKGVRNNISFVRSIMTHPRFIEGRLTTNFIAEEFVGGYQGHQLTQQQRANLLAIMGALRRQMEQVAATGTGRLNSAAPAALAGADELIVKLGEKSYTLGLIPEGLDTFRQNLPASKFTISVHDGDAKTEVKIELSPISPDGLVVIKVDGVPLTVQATSLSLSAITIQYLGSKYSARVFTPREAVLHSYLPPKKVIDTSKMLIANMPGVVTSIAVNVGDKLSPGQEILVVEAMKMQNVLRCEAPATVAKVNVKTGTVISVGEVLVNFE